MRKEAFMRSKLLILFSLSLLGLNLIGCAADLIAVTKTGSTSPPTDFCNLRSGQLVVVVKNQGNELSGPFTTKVEFFKGGTYETGSPVVIAVPAPALLAFPALAPGGSQELVLPPVISDPALPSGILIPAECYNLPPGPLKPCNFRITVNAVAPLTNESNTANNIAIGTCTLP
jgi:hypothetical protein